MSDLPRSPHPNKWTLHRQPAADGHHELETRTSAIAHGLSLNEAIDTFLLSRQVANCTVRTVQLYREVLTPFRNAIDDSLSGCIPLALHKYFAALRSRVNGTTAHLHFSKLRAFFAWATDVGLLSSNPMRGITMKAPRTLPRAPEDWEVSRLLDACASTWEGVRNRTLVALLADSALRISETLHLRVCDVNFKTQTVIIHAGKGQQDGVAQFGVRVAEQLRIWLAVRRRHAPEDFLFCCREGRPLTRVHALHLLHRLSVRAGLQRKIGPHALRSYAATSLLRRTGDLELTRRVLRHASLMMTLRYAILTGADVAAKFQRASPLDNLDNKDGGRAAR